jgi:hypothetical protein
VLLANRIKPEGRRKKEEGRRKKEDGRRKKEDGRNKNNDAIQRINTFTGDVFLSSLIIFTEQSTQEL